MYIIGVDEAGRGALAGPIVVAAVLVPKKIYLKSVKLPKLKDSKKLSPIQRQAWFSYLRNHPRIIYTTARVYPRRIENINIAKAANIASSRALIRLLKFFEPPSNCRVFLDGSLYIENKNFPPKAPAYRTGRDSPPAKKLKIRTVIRGDEKFVSIKLASIIAKVTRDNYMIGLHRKYPRYQFHLHKGYGTLLHRNRINRFGPAEVHRLTYLKKYRKLAAT